MPLYTIVREMPGATEADLEASAVRAIICSYEYPGMRWIRSYWDGEASSLLCLFEATSPEHVREHARRARIPCGEVREVEVITPDRFVSSALDSEVART